MSRRATPSSTQTLKKKINYYLKRRNNYLFLTSDPKRIAMNVPIEFKMTFGAAVKMLLFSTRAFFLVGK